ncbi:MAG: SUF system NifU family Fe-S cluster assembly protein [Solobacterium sp.]|nr:SUF system NifU family Fe-S cluster assembly protein [Solobacterium sp.]
MSEYKNLLDDPEVLRELIMDHYKYPHNHVLKEGAGYKKIHMASASCIDDITVQADIENGIIKDINFAGIGCTISTASTSMMTDLLVGKTIAEAKDIVDNYFRMVNAEAYDADKLDEAVAMKNVWRQANRINCATIGWRAMRQMIEESEGSHE